MNILKDILGVSKDLTVLSTGQNPELNKDLLVVGELTRDEFQSSLLEALVNVAEARLSDDAIVVQQDDNKVGVAYYTECSFNSLVADVANGRAIDPIVKHWSLGPWLPEIFASDMARSLTLTESDSDSSRVAELFRQYPDPLREAIIARSLSEIAMKTAMLEVGQYELSSKFLAMDICLASMRLLYATEKIYFRGFKYEPLTRTSLSYEAGLISNRIMMNPASEDSSMAVGHYLLSERRPK